MVCELTDSASAARLRRLPAHLAAHIRGQPEALEIVASVLTRGELGLTSPRRPKGSFLFIGPTGVGKTETVNVFTDYLFGALPIRFDMSEYQLQHSVDKLIGGSRDDRGLLGCAVLAAQRGILLFDELEKAHPLVLDLFLQILEDGRITLATGESVDVRPFYVVFTSNIGSREVMGMASPPFSSVKRTVLMRASQQLRPELYGRITEKVVFARLDYLTQRAVCEQMVAAECARLSELGHAIRVAPEALEFLVREGYHKTLGARPMRGAIERHLQEAIASALLSGGPARGLATITAARDRLALNPAA
ncbi:MAG TPA: AAA family ATPase [Opitutaceae bacterium]|nr:AAA family ATPase [Opitutaceae bacterium]